MGHVWDAYEAAKKVNDLDRNYRNAILESAALVAEQIDNCVALRTTTDARMTATGKQKSYCRSYPRAEGA